MKYAYNTLIPKHIQNELMTSAEAGRIDLIDRAAQEAAASMPHLFHNEQTLARRTFHNEPRQLVPNAGFNVPYPLSSGSRD